MTMQDESDAIWHVAFWTLWSKRLIPALQAVTPNETGQLYRALTPRFEYPWFWIEFKRQGFYWHFQEGLIERYRQVILANLPIMLAFANEQAGVEYEFTYSGREGDVFNSQK